MNITNIKTGGFTNIEKVNLNLKKLNALIALNNYGKSNVIKSIEFGFDFIRYSSEKKTRLMSHKSIIPINKYIDSQPYKFEFSFKTRLNKKSHIACYGYSFDWIKTTGKGQVIRDEYLKIKEISRGSKYKVYLKRNKSKGYYLPSPKGRCDKEINIKNNELIINKLTAFDDLFYSKIIESINNIEIPYIDTLENPKRLFRIIEPEIVRAGYSLKMPRGSEVGYFIYSLKKKKPDLYELFEDAVKSLLNGIEKFYPLEIDLKKESQDETENIPTEFPDKLYDIRVKEINNNQETDISGISAGSQRIFYILALTFAAGINKIPLISFEELENSIHPGLLQKLLIILDSLSENTKIITTSHSPYLIQYLDTNKIKIGIPNQKGLAVFKEIKKSKFNKIVSLADDEGTSVGDVIFDNLIGESDSELLNELCD